VRRILQAGLTALAFLALVALGVWQLDRRATKTELLDRIAVAERTPAVDLPVAVDPSMLDDFRIVSATGTLDHRKALFWRLEPRTARDGSVEGGTLLVVPLLRDGSAPLWTVLGWIPERQLAEAPRKEPSVTTVQGFLRPPGARALFAPPDDTMTRRFFTLDPVAFSAASDLPAPVPGVLVSLGPAPKVGEYPDPARTLPRPPNDHLTYALTWFSLAAGLLLVAYFYFARRRDPA